MVGLLGLHRGDALVLAAVVLVWVWLRPRIGGGRRATHAAAFVGGMAIILLPVAQPGLQEGRRADTPAPVPW